MHYSLGFYSTALMQMQKTIRRTYHFIYKQERIKKTNHQVEADSFFPECSSQISLPIYVVLISERFHPELFQSVFDLFKKFNKNIVSILTVMKPSETPVYCRDYESNNAARIW